MGEVHVARDEDLLRKVAYKKMVAEVAHSRELAARFFSEIQVTAQLDHPNIVPIYGLEVASDGALGYSMKLVQGKTLTSVLGEARRDGGGELAARLEIFLKVCDAIAYAHSKGVLHRDLKPDNVMVGRYNEVYVMDWGICRVIGSDNPEADKLELAPGIGAAAPSERTQYGAVIGTPAYMSPEQASGRNPELDGRSDVYALGLILFEVVSLRQAITGKQVLEVLGRAAIGDKDPLFGATHELRAIVAKATAADREQRYPTASALADDLRRVLRGEAPRCAPDNPLRRLARWVGRHRVAALVVIAALTALAGAVTIAVLLHAQQALARARGREQRVQALAAAVSQQAHAIDSQLHAAEALLFGLASQTAQLIEMPPAAELLAGTTIYFDEDYALAGHGPPDLAPSSYYRRPVSLASATVKLPPGVSREAVAAELRLVPALYRPLANVFFYAVGAEAKVAGPIVLATGGPLLDTFVTLESGVHVRYPGFGGYLPDYDGRQRAAYQLAAGKQGVFWGKPYLDRSGFGLILPVSASIYDPKGKLLGVCGAETTFRHIAAAILGLPGYPAVEREYLVDERARVVVQATARSGKIVEYGAAAHGQHGEQSKRGKDGKQSKDGDGSSGDGHADRPIDPQPLPFPAVAQAILAGRPSGVLTLGETLFAYQRFSAIGWYYVVQVSEQGLVSR
jgi:serine/threonine-protein kinase